VLGVQHQEVESRQGQELGDAFRRPGQKAAEERIARAKALAE